MKIGNKRESGTGNREGWIDRAARARPPVPGSRFPTFIARLPILLLALFLAPAHAVEPDEMLADAALEARARDISRDLRCLVCQSQSIDDSSAPLAKDLRLIVRERIVAGDSDAQTKAFVVARYGEFVLLKPRWSATTIALWTAPALLLGLAGLAGVLALRARRDGPTPLTAQEEMRLKEME